MHALTKHNITPKFTYRYHNIGTVKASQTFHISTPPSDINTTIPKQNFLSRHKTLITEDACVRNTN